MRSTLPLPKGIYTAEDYWNLPADVRAELIDGELWDLAAPTRVHQRIMSTLTTRFTNHIASQGGSCEVYPAPFAVNLFADDTTLVEPDLCVVCDKGKLSHRGCEGAPDLAVEVVSPSSKSMDYISKLHLYRDAGVREYWICDPLRERVLVYAFESDDLLTMYSFQEPAESTIFPGFAVVLGEAIS